MSLDAIYKFEYTNLDNMLYDIKYLQTEFEEGFDNIEVTRLSFIWYKYKHTLHLPDHMHNFKCYKLLVKYDDAENFDDVLKNTFFGEQFTHDYTEHPATVYYKNQMNAYHQSLLKELLRYEVMLVEHKNKYCEYWDGVYQLDIGFDFERALWFATEQVIVKAINHYSKLIPKHLLPHKYLSAQDKFELYGKSPMMQAQDNSGVLK